MFSNDHTVSEPGRDAQAINQPSKQGTAEMHILFSFVRLNSQYQSFPGHDSETQSFVYQQQASTTVAERWL